jgi:hypothetical protein
MKPKPLASLNHLTVPTDITLDLEKIKKGRAHAQLQELQ